MFEEARRTGCHWQRISALAHCQLLQSRYYPDGDGVIINRHQWRENLLRMRVQFWVTQSIEELGMAIINRIG